MTFGLGKINIALNAAGKWRWMALIAFDKNLQRYHFIFNASG